MLHIRKQKGGFYHVRGTVRVGTETRIIKEHSTGCRERGAAEAYKAKLERDIQAELLHGVEGRARAVTFADAGKMYLDRPGGLHRNDIWRIGQLNDVIGDFAVADLPEAWRLFRSRRCAGLAPATVDRFRATLQAAVNHAAREIGMAVPRLPRVKFRNTRARYLTIDEQDALIGAYVTYVQPIATVLCFQGCRTQEALQLHWRNVDFRLRTLRFDRTKSGEPRVVNMHQRVFAALTKIHAQRAAPQPDDHVFLNRLGRPYADTRDYKLPGGNPIAKTHKTACRHAGIVDFRVHDWRHHWASWCVMNGVDLPTLQRWGGWRSLRMIERYATLSAEHLSDAMDKLSAKWA